MESERTDLTDEDIQKARDTFEKFLNLGSKKKGGRPDNGGISRMEHHEDYLLMKLDEGHEIHGKREIKIVTVFHPVSVKVEDQYGGILECKYSHKKTVGELYDWMLDKYPRATAAEIQQLADTEGISFDEAKMRIALRIAEVEFFLRIEIAKFIHNQLEPTLKLVLDDLVEDAMFYGLSTYGYKLGSAKDFDKRTKEYIQFRKERTNFVRKKGQRGEAAVSAKEVARFIQMVFEKMEELDEARKRITPNSVARKAIGSNHSNPLKAFKDKLKKYGFSFDDLRNKYEKSKSEQNNI